MCANLHFDFEDCPLLICGRTDAVVLPANINAATMVAQQSIITICFCQWKVKTDVSFIEYLIDVNTFWL